MRNHANTLWNVESAFHEKCTSQLDLICSFRKSNWKNQRSHETLKHPRARHHALTPPRPCPSVSKILANLPSLPIWIPKLVKDITQSLHSTSLKENNVGMSNSLCLSLLPIIRTSGKFNHSETTSSSTPTCQIAFAAGVGWLPSRNKRLHDSSPWCISTLKTNVKLKKRISANLYLLTFSMSAWNYQAEIIWL